MGLGADGASPPAGPAARSRSPARRALSRREPGRNSRLPPVVMAQGGSGQRQPVGQPLDRLLGSFAVERHQRSRASGDADEIGAPPVGSDQGRLDDISAVVDGAFVSLSGHGSVGSEYGDFVRSRETTILPPAAGTDQAKEGAKTHPHRPGCWGRYPWFRQKKICPPLLIHTLRTCHAQDFHSAWGSTRRGPRRASCCRDCSPPRPSCSALRTSLCCPGLRGGRRGGLGRTGSRGARSRTAGKGFDDGRGRGGAAGRTRGPARRRPSPRPGRAPGRGAWVSAVPPVDRVRHGDPRISSSSGIPGGRSEADGPGGGRGQTDGLGLGGGFEDHSSAGSPHRGTRRPDPVGAAVAVDGCPGSRDA